MQETLSFIIEASFLGAVGVLFILAGIFRWKYPQLVNWESAEYSTKNWVRVIKVIVGAGLIICVIYFGIDRFMR